MVMRGPQSEPIVLTDSERATLEQIERRHTTPQQIALRARIVLAAAAGRNIAETARDLAISLDMVRRWRRRWLALQAVSLDDLPVLERLTDAPRSGKPVRISDEQVCQILELACDAPEHSGRPISQWSEREIAEEVRARGIVDLISDRHAARLLKRGRFSRTAGATG
jgi:putative transposase